MNGLLLEADLIAGQKTGVYLDQRENYAAAARYARGAVLDAFTSTGGFALHLAGRAERIEAVDSSAAALETARRNQAVNGIGNIAFTQADVFDLLAAYVQQGRRYDTVVLDPPAFTKTRGSVESASRGYKEINLRAMRLLTPGGVLVTCSCSHHMSEPRFLEILAEAAAGAGRTLRVLERRGQAQDHPVLLSVPETQYLKCIILQAV
jgi:23S rRNA (cytosine1962-C5)-methyltransferase